MNKTITLPPALPETSYPTRSSEPKLTYAEAQSWFLVTAEQGVMQVSACSSSNFATFVETCLEASPKKAQACAEELGDLDYTDPLSRWFIIDLLLSYGFPVALFATVEEAAAYHKICG